jgi:predicted transcriptional regulator of viral defense system
MIMSGKNYELIYAIGESQYGYITAAEALNVGVSVDSLKKMTKRGTLERINRGVYRIVLFPFHELNQYMEAVLWPQGARGILSHETALNLYDVCDVNPAKIHLTIPKTHRVQREVPKLYKLYNRDLADKETTYFEGIPVVTCHRAILDCIEAYLRQGLIEQSLINGKRRGLFTVGHKL